MQKKVLKSLIEKGGKTVIILCIVFFLNNQPDALIIQIYSIKNLYRFRASSLPIIRSYLLYILHL